MTMNKNDRFSKTILILLTVGIWLIVLRNFGILPVRNQVYIKGGYVDATVSGSVDVENEVEISGYVDVNIDAINGHSNAFYKDTDGDFVLLPMVIR